MTRGHPLYPARIKVWARISLTNLPTVSLSDTRGVDLDLVGLQLAYAVNAIPVGRIQFAIGVDNKLQPAKIHEHAAALRHARPIHIYMSIEPDERMDWKSRIPRGTFLIFEGLTLGSAGMRRGTTQALFEMGVVGWLQGLAATTAACGKFMADRASGDVPDNLFVPFALESTGAAGRETQISALNSSAVYDWRDDLWVAIDKALRALAEGSAVALSDGILPAVDRPNRFTIDALNRFNKEPHVRPGRLKFKSCIPDTTELARGVSQEIVFILQQRSGSPTAWDKILHMANMFAFALIPTVSSATVVPLVRQLPASRAWRTIDASEIFSINIFPYTPRPLVGMVLVPPPMHPSPVGGPDAAAQRELVRVWSWPTQALSAPGLVLARTAPMWLSGEVGTLADRADADRAAHPPNSVGGDIKERPARAARQAPACDVGTDLARWWFYDEQFKQATGDLIGRLRFDIGPGSHVKIRGIVPEELGLPGNITSDVYATVWGVGLSVTIGQQVSASIQYQLANVRGGADIDHSVDGHPLYEREEDGSVWNGTHLIDEPT